MFYSGFVNHYQDIFPFREGTFQFLRSQCLPNAKTILDIGCATGHYTTAFKHEGYNAVGIDLDADMIAYARECYPNTPFYAMNMLHIADLQRNFDTIYSTGNTLAHLVPQNLGPMLKAIYNTLVPGGIWLFQTVNWDYILKQPQHEFPKIKVPEKDLTFARSYPYISKSQVTFTVQLDQAGKQVYHAEQTLYPVTSRQYLELHQNAGFTLVGHYADFNKTPYQSNINSANIMTFKKEGN